MKTLAIKIHYDSRPNLTNGLKYSMPPKAKDYAKFFNEGCKNNTGLGFHECLNFYRASDGKCRIYLPPTTAEKLSKKIGERVNLIWVIYGNERNCKYKGHIVGVHRNALILASDSSLQRSDFPEIEGEISKEIDKRLFSHAEADADDSILFSEPIPFKLNRYLPHLKVWNQGFRYMDEDKFRLILEDRIKVIGNTSSYLEKEEKKVLQGYCSIPDKELGRLGEEFVYRKELEYLKEHGCDSSGVEWVAARYPQSPFDIKTLRFIDGVPVTHYLEVKSTKSMKLPNIYISRREIDFAERQGKRHDVVIYDAETKSAKYYSLSKIRQMFDLQPIEYKLKAKRK